MFSKYVTFFFLSFLITINIAAQNDDNEKATKKDTAATTAKPPKQKEIKKLEDPLLALPQDLIDRMKKMKPNQLLMIDEKFMRNEKRADESGEEYEVTVTVRMGFSQDMITGIVKEVPLYNTNGRETNIIYVKIPVKFCCTTPIDTLHTKQHCGKMSELNDFEDNEHCKDWAQKEEAFASAGGGFGKPGGSKPGSSTKKGGGVSGQTSINGDDDFGKPMPKGKPTKKGKNTKGKTVEEDNDASDSTNVGADSVKTKPTSKPAVTKDKKASPKEKEEGFGKPTPVKKGFGKKQKGVTQNEAEADETPVSDSTQKNAEPVKQEKKEEPDFGKPQPKEKGKKKEDKKASKEKKETSDTEAPASDSTQNENKSVPPVKVEKKKEDDQKKEEVEDFGKPQPKEKGKKKKEDKKETDPLPEETKPISDTSGVAKDTTALPTTKPSENKKKRKG